MELKRRLPATQFPSAIWGLPRILFEVEDRWDGVCCDSKITVLLFKSNILMERALEIPCKSTTVEAFYSREVPAAQVSHREAAGGFRIHPEPSRDADGICKPQGAGAEQGVTGVPGAATPKLSHGHLCSLLLSKIIPFITFMIKCCHRTPPFSPPQHLKEFILGRNECTSF